MIFEECLQRSPDDETLYDSLLEAYATMEQYDEMMKLIDKKEALFGSHGILVKRAFVHVHKDDYETANELFWRYRKRRRVAGLLYVGGGAGIP